MRKSDLFLIGLSGPVTLSAGSAVTDVGPTGQTYNHGSFNQQSLGLRLIDTLTTQLGGTLALNAEHGTRFNITLTAPEQPNKEF